MYSQRDIYAHKAVSQISRLLSMQDRNPFSPTYGCFHRDYWLDKTSDFPDAVRQFAVHALALVYKYDFPGSIYKDQPHIRDWAIAGLDYWASIQHQDGSFDEFYPYERGWVGPTAFTTFTAIETFQLLRDEIPHDTAQRIIQAIERAAYFISKGESEEDHLANHHAMACLTVWKAYRLLGDTHLKQGFEQLWNGFLSYHNHTEGWSREYDGVDPGYLSATVSFLGKIYQDNRDPRILNVLQQSVDFCSYFVYPNGFYAGSMGSRNTLHFYPHGFEILASDVPMASAIANKMLIALGEEKLVPPEIMTDRYAVYRVPELLQSYIDWAERADTLPPLPYEREPFTHYFAESRIFVANRPNHYILANLAKGGVIKAFNRQSGNLILNDCGIIGQLADDKIVTSQWIDPNYKCDTNEEGCTVQGYLQIVPSNKLFDLPKNLLFRSTLLALGWNPELSHLLKGSIRKTLMLGRRPIPARFTRTLALEADKIILRDDIQLEDDLTFRAMSVGGEFFVRYVPQSRYFQNQELTTHTQDIAHHHIQELNTNKHLRIQQVIQLDHSSPTTQPVGFTISTSPNSASDLQMGVYDVDYFAGRQNKPQLIYRLRRRTDEVESALRRFSNGHTQVIVDVGTADGLMLHGLQKRMGDRTFLGIDLSMGLLKAYQADGIDKTQGDACCLPVQDNAADAVIATAIIEHVPNPNAMMREVYRVMRPGGLLILTTPDPLMERISTTLGILKEAGHQETFNLSQLENLARVNGFHVLEAKKFMFSPVGFPAEKQIEQIFGPLGLSYAMANQLIVAQKP